MKKFFYSIAATAVFTSCAEIGSELVTPDEIMPGVQKVPVEFTSSPFNSYQEGTVQVRRTATTFETDVDTVDVVGTKVFVEGATESGVYLRKYVYRNGKLEPATPEDTLYIDPSYVGQFYALYPTSFERNVSDAMYESNFYTVVDFTDQSNEYALDYLHARATNLSIGQTDVPLTFNHAGCKYEFYVNIAGVTDISAYDIAIQFQSEIIFARNIWGVSSNSQFYHLISLKRDNADAGKFTAIYPPYQISAWTITINGETKPLPLSLYLGLSQGQKYRVNVNVTLNPGGSEGGSGATSGYAVTCTDITITDWVDYYDNPTDVNVEY
jgi:hypothetical protein